MAQAKKKTSTKTKKTTAKASPRKTNSRACTRTAKCKGVSSSERVHVYFIAAMSIIAGVLLCADVAMMIV